MKRCMAMLRKNAPSVEQDVCLQELALVKNIAVEGSNMDNLGVATRDGVQKTISVMKEYMNLRTDMAPDDVYTNRFLSPVGNSAK